MLEDLSTLDSIELALPSIDEYVTFLNDYPFIHTLLSFEVFCRDYTDLFPAEWLELESTITIDTVMDLFAHYRQHFTASDLVHSSSAPPPVSYHSALPHTIPDSLKQFIARCIHLSPPQEPSNPPPKIDSLSFSSISMKEKKYKQIERLISVISSLKTRHTTSSTSPTSRPHVIDVGGGVGHLGRALAHAGFNTTVIEQSEQLTERGKQLLTQKRLMKPSISTDGVDQHRPGMLTPASVSFSTQTITAEWTPLFIDTHPHTIVSAVHACGDFGSTVVRAVSKYGSEPVDTIVEQQQTLWLVHLPCCFHSLTDCGFPVSSEANRLIMASETKNTVLTPQIRHDLLNLACQDVSVNLTHDKEGISKVMMSRGRRDLLQIIVEDVITATVEANIDIDIDIAGPLRRILFPKRSRLPPTASAFPAYLLKQGKAISKRILNSDRLEIDILKSKLNLDPMIQGFDDGSIVEQHLHAVIQRLYGDIDATGFEDTAIWFYNTVLFRDTDVGPSGFKQLLFRHLLLTFCSRALEGFIVKDRVELLLESSVDASVILLCTPRLTPRNMCIIARARKRL
eukprot:gnl/Dysnectes_brevis/2122_a2466_796.p1 GENE.gnl/Dysnectes_brevis/2122_a2466_796~~gnl/Dysnectes_brevis/2122_a2466_796.p1  ORF type:complete len:568 (-),score=58.52 gnl/Dysnectes_brevis/2122_a2466_796:547-2250(-)